MVRKEEKDGSVSGLETNMEECDKAFVIKRHEILLKDGQVVLLRPLTPDDKAGITEFFSRLSPDTRRFYVLDNYGAETASKLCESVANAEKLHFVIENNFSEIVALMKFSLDLPEVDRLRFSQYSIKLIPGTVSRCGLCIADQYQSMGLGAITLQQVVDSSDSLNQEVIMLSGGIFANNERAIRLAQKFGFRTVGRFTDSNSQDHVDMLRVKK